MLVYSALLDEILCVTKGLQGTYLNWSLQPAGCAVGNMSGKKEVPCWDQGVTCTNVVESQAEQVLCRS